MARAEPRIYRFADCQLDRRQRMLRRQGRPIALQPRQFDLLLYLLDHHDRVVPLDELMREVWRGVHVHQQSLRYALHSVRRAIGDRGDRQRLIRTHPKQGLRFAGEVDATSSDASFLGSAGLLGRKEILSELAQAVEALVASKTGRAFHIRGEAGIGKTLLLSAIEDLSVANGLETVNVRCQGRENEPAYWPWTRLLRRLIKKGEMHAEIEPVVRRCPELAWALPELLEGDNLHGDPAFDARTARHRLFDAVVALLTAISGSKPLVICLDDLHEADDDTLALTSYVAGESVGIPLLLAAASRDPGGRAAERQVAGLEGAGATDVHLSGLSTSEVGELVEADLGVSASREATASLHRRTAGNPFFLRTLLGLIGREERDPGSIERALRDVRVPREARLAVLRQARGLGEPTRDLLDVASAVGLEFSEALVGAAAGLVGPGIHEMLEPALRKGIVVEAGPRGLWRFAHPLVRECLYDEMASARRCANHLGIARLLEKQYGLPRGPDAVEIARHYSRAAPLPEAARAIDFYLEASEIDVARAGFEAARASLDAAFQLLARLGSTDAGLRARIWLRIGNVDGLLLRRESSRAALEQASREAMRAGRHDIVCEAALSFSPHLLAIETGVYDADLVRLLRRAKEVGKDQSPSRRARVAARLAVALHWGPGSSSAEIRSLIGEATVIAKGADDPSAAAFVSVASRVAQYRPGGSTREGSRVSGLVGTDPETELMARVLRVTDQLEAGDLMGAELEVEQLSRVVDESGIRSASWYQGMLRASIALVRGDFSAAASLGDAYLAEGKAVFDQNAFHSYVLQRAMLALDLGPIEESLPAVARMASEYRNVVGWDAGLCLVLAEIGRRDEANARLDRLIAARILEGVPRNTWLGMLGCLALAAWELDREDLAPALYDAWKPYSGQMVVLGFGSFCWGAADRFLAVLAALSGARERAENHFTAAIDLNRRCGALPALAHSQRDYAVSGWAAPCRADAAMQSAIDLAGRLGMRRLVGKISRRDRRRRGVARQ